MSSGFCPLDDAFNHQRHQSDLDDMITTEDLLFLSGLSPLSDVSLDSFFQDIPELPNHIIPDPNPVPNPDPATNFIQVTQTSEILNTVSESLDQFIQQIGQPADTFLPYQQTHFPDPQNSSNFSNGFVAGDGFGAGNEPPPYFTRGYSYGSGQNVAGVQGGYNCGPQFNGMPWQPCFHPYYPTFGGPPAFLSSGNNFTFDQFGRPYCAGGMQGGSFFRPTFIDDETPRMRRYNPEERKKKIEKYREKRSQRNFSKKIKYPSRKTVAESMTRVRGRFSCIEVGEGSCG